MRRRTRCRSCASSKPDAVVADILTLAPALAAEMDGRPWATLIPHVHPARQARAPDLLARRADAADRARARAMWRRAQPVVQRGLERGRRELNETRERLGLPALAHVHGGISTELAIVATFPQLEYPRPWPSHVHVVGPLMWEPPAQEDPPASWRARSPRTTSARSCWSRPPPRRTPSTGCSTPRCAGWPTPRCVCSRPGTGGCPRGRSRSPTTRGSSDWVVYTREMPRCAVVVCHAGHGTLVRALSCGCAVVACPAVGDMNENAARVDWAGAGVRLPRRFISPRTVRLAVERAIDEPSIRARARELARWNAEHDPGAQPRRSSSSSARAQYCTDGRRRLALLRRGRSRRHDGARGHAGSGRASCPRP